MCLNIIEIVLNVLTNSGVMCHVLTQVDKLKPALLWNETGTTEHRMMKRARDWARSKISKKSIKKAIQILTTWKNECGENVLEWKWDNIRREMKGRWTCQQVSQGANFYLRWKNDQGRCITRISVWMRVNGVDMKWIFIKEKIYICW